MRIFLTIFLLLTVFPTFAQQEGRQRWLGTFIRRTIFVDTTRRDALGDVVDEEEILKKYNGRTIGSITVDRHDVFERQRSVFQKVAGGIHVRTMDGIVRNDLLFSQGDVFDAATVVRSSQILHSRKYISRASITAEPDAVDSTKVALRIETFDSWTIGVGARGYSGSRAMADLYDVNFLGSGVRVGLKSHFRYKKWRLGGEVLDIETPNFLGTFYSAELHAGRDFDSKRLEAAFGKGFILPDDYEFGATYSDVDDRKTEVYMPDSLARVRVWRRAMSVWGGFSRHVAGRTNAYLTTHFNHEEYPARPWPLGRGVDPAFHGKNELLAGAGFYKERFFSSTMIYGYGFNEYVATGMRAEMVGGLSWQEFGDYYYGGAQLLAGDFWSGGYLSGNLSVGTYWDMHGGGRYRSVVDGRVFWFSNLWDTQGTSKMRQFVTLHYTQGWNMGAGAGSRVGFSGDVRPVGFKGYGAGRTRLLMNTETVFFTRHRPFGFRLAVFGFCDAGFVGMQENPFRNDFFSTFGLGIRFKNERLIFNALQIRVGLAVGKSGFVRSQIVRASTEQRIEQQHFSPARPEIVEFE